MVKKKKPSKRVAIVVPLSFEPNLTEDEQLSLAQLRTVLGRYDKFMIAPEKLDVQHEDFTTIQFDDPYFGSLENHCRLLVSPHFYEVFSDYQYILIHHLDSFVFSDQLAEWCEQGYDYIAPPWIPYKGAPHEGCEIENQCGTGGLSLRKLDSIHRVLRKLRQPRFARDYLASITRLRPPFENRFIEDVFWGTQAVKIDPTFNVAPVEDALKFGFELNPRLCLEKNNGKIPFGCHAWARYDRAFWEPHMPPKNQV